MRYNSSEAFIVVLVGAGCLGVGFQPEAQAQNVQRVVVLPDTEGPLAVEARGDDRTFATRHAKAIAITFNEPLRQDLSTNLSNFNVYAGTSFTTRINITNIFYNFSQAPRIYLFMNGPQWISGNDYFVVLNNVADAKGNLIAPNTRVPVCWEIASGGLRCSPLPAEPPLGQLLLSIRRQGAEPIVSWPKSFGGYSLEYQSDFFPGLSWLTVSNQANAYTSTLGDGVRLFRLRKP
jgi:hypothetical protein